MALQEPTTIFAYHQRKFYKTAILFTCVCNWIFALTPCCKSHKIYFVYVAIWCCEISFTCYFTIKNQVLGNGDGLSGLVNIVVYFTHIVGHIIVLMESCFVLSNRTLVFQQFSNIRKTVEDRLEGEQNLKLSDVRLGRVVMGVLVMLACGHVIAALSPFNSKSPASLLYWISLQSYLALQFKTLEFLSDLLQLNYHIIIIRQLLDGMGERSMKRVFKKTNTKYRKPKIIQIVTVSKQEKDEKILLKVVKDALSDVYIAFQLYNEIHGWSLLYTTAVYFIDFVCNSYWVLFAILTHSRDYYGIYQNASFALMAFLLLSITCWYAEECYCESRLIGCLISKLAKPLGNKDYNDLVSEFSIQILHQRFTITAKEFFSLNLHLLGKMVAAIVTYLVILIQFMLTENNKTGNSG